MDFAIALAAFAALVLWKAPAWAVVAATAVPLLHHAMGHDHAFSFPLFTTGPLRTVGGERRDRGAGSAATQSRGKLSSFPWRRRDWARPA